MLGISNSPLYPAFKSLIDVLCYPIRLLDAHGRLGGVVALVCGVLMLYGGLWVATTTSLWGLGLCGGGVAYVGYGLSRFFGQEARLRREYLADARVETMTREQLETELRSRALPFFVCVRCHVAMEPAECGGRCLVCGSEADCLPVSEDADRQTVTAAIY
ncbi:MAG: hypothetical protein AB1Z98_22425 [Nannocystaceae bacterium]